MDKPFKVELYESNAKGKRKALYERKSMCYGFCSDTNGDSCDTYSHIWAIIVDKDGFFDFYDPKFVKPCQ